MRAHFGAAMAFAMSSAQASAHPIHEVVQNAYLTLSPGMVGLQLELTAGPQVAGKIVSALDTDRDRQVSKAEANAFARRVLANSRLAIDRKASELKLVSIDVPSYPALLGAHGTVRIVAQASRRDAIGLATLSYRNGYSPAESRCDANVFLKPGAQLRYAVARQGRSADGRELTVRYGTVKAP